MKAKLVVLSILVFLLALCFAVAAPTNASTTLGSSETYDGTAGSSESIEGGNVTYIDTDANIVTERWGAFYGNLSGDIILADSAGTNFYSWTVNSMTGAVVYAANGSVSDWTAGNIVPLDVNDTPSYLQTSAFDNFTQTFSSSEDFNTSSLDEASVPYTITYNSSGVPGNLKTYALWSTADTTNIWAGMVVDDTDSFQGSTVDYQILLPAQGITAYNFYLELP